MPDPAGQHYRRTFKCFTNLDLKEDIATSAACPAVAFKLS